MGRSHFVSELHALRPKGNPGLKFFDVIDDGVSDEFFRDLQKPNRRNRQTAFLCEAADDILSHELVSGYIIPLHEVKVIVIPFAKKRAARAFFGSSADTNNGDRHEQVRQFHVSDTASRQKCQNLCVE